MQILVAEDDRITRTSVVRQLEAWGHTVTPSEDGEQAWTRFGDGEYDVVITDWDMPRLSGVELVRRIRAALGARFVYIIMLTGRSDKADLVSGIEAGADDFVSKPFDREELRARLQAGIRIVTLQAALALRVHELEEALSRVRTLQGLLPICSYCKRVRNDGDYWQQVESYVSDHSDARFSHGICPDCYDSVVRPQLESLTPPGRKAS